MSRCIHGVTLSILLVAGVPTKILADDPPRVIVIANENVPASVELARRYLERRDIPTHQLCLLDLPDSELIVRTQFESRLRDPLLAWLREGEFIEQTRRKKKEVKRHESHWKTDAVNVDYLVSIYGVPLRIADTKFKPATLLADKLKRPEYKNTAAVDSELALLFRDGYPVDGFMPNPMYHRLLRSELNGSSAITVPATRLDGPTPEDVRRMIDQSVEHEKYGLLGRAFFDVRGIQEGSFIIGDYWLRSAFHRFRREGYECVMNFGERPFSGAYPMENVAVYFGWYTENLNGPFRREDFRFRPGAIAYHIHSGSARTLRSDTNRWSGPLIARGAAATAGAVSEPFLRHTLDIEVFADRLCAGHTLADSAYMALGSLSWQMTIIGDPLYRPFKHTLDKQIQLLEEADREDVDWAYIRKVNVLVREGRFNLAIDCCRQKIQQTGSLNLLEKLGQLYDQNNLFNEAGAVYERILDETNNPVTAIRVGARWMLILRLTGDEERADALEESLREKWPDSPLLAWLKTALTRLQDGGTLPHRPPSSPE